jgi:putative acetyltransferase
VAGWGRVVAMSDVGDGRGCEDHAAMGEAASDRYSVRRAAVEDAPAVHKVRQRAIRESAAGHYDVDALEAWASGGSERELRRKIATTAAFVAVVRGQAVGWATLDSAEVEQLYVDPDHGGRGLAWRLYKTIENVARSHSVPRLTAVASLRAIPVFRRFGFTEVRREDRPFNGHSFEVADMVKRL